MTNKTEKVTISRIAFFNKDKDGNELKNKQGKPYTRVLIDTVDGRTMSGFKNQTTANWEEGMEVEVEVQEREYNGKTYYNFNTPKQAPVDLSEVNNKLDRILALLEPKNVSESTTEPQEAISEEDVPW